MNDRQMYIARTLSKEEIEIRDLKAQNAELIAALRELKNYVLDENAASTPLGEAAARAEALLAKIGNSK